ncbi:methyl-accepting chemotaxis protein [Wenxinia saemankumensis]|uniref:Methyl-accepting chemotaxis protein n=1 Tax=Wenxinia saemankumensis TaxID=1447782 RepID=A0A1M6CV81_9RHOB|nr:methyl-accepting chemotaxis protein [Wenxinia saemankumensis]SHI64995.1 methyl-accepting chemotaxis protein [Wenxinia saemankumensis]
MNRLVQRFDSLRLSLKLPAIPALLTLTVALLLTLAAARETRETLRTGAAGTLRAVAEAEAMAVESWIEGLSTDVEMLARTPSIAVAMREFADGYAALGEGAADTLLAAYATGGPADPLAREDVLDAGTGSVYDRTHARRHAFLRDLRRHYGLYDIFLIDPAGRVVYTSFKETDFGQPLEAGPLAGSGLAEAWIAALAEADSGGTAARLQPFRPYAPSMGAPAAFLSAPIRGAAGEVLGVLAIQLPVDRLWTRLADAPGLGETGEIVLLGPDGLMLNDLRHLPDLGAFDPLPPLETPLVVEPGQADVFVDRPGLSGAPVVGASIGIELDGRRWGILAQRDLAEVDAALWSTVRVMAAESALLAALAVAFGIFLARTVTLPLERIKNGLQRMTRGDYGIELRAADRGDEIGTIARAVLQFRDMTVGEIERRSEAEAAKARQDRVVAAMRARFAALSDGDLGGRLEIDVPQEFTALRDDINTTIARWRELIAALSARSGEIRDGTDAIARSAEDLSRRTESQAVTLEQTAAALDELTASVREAARTTGEVEKIARDSRQDAESSRAVIASAIGAMKRIEGRSDEIGHIIGVIDDIAFQTNLLALNAGVEAARAGEAGRGFAVVASEVRALAQRSSEAAGQIKGLISGSRLEVADGVRLVDEAAQALGAIVDRVAQISDLVTEIARGASEQATGLAEINTGVSQLDEVTQANAAMAEENTAAAHDLSARAGEMGRQVARFRLDSGGTARIPRAA